jgi:hypothetical protein
MLEYREGYQFKDMEEGHQDLGIKEAFGFLQCMAMPVSWKITSRKPLDTDTAYNLPSLQVMSRAGSYHWIIKDNLRKPCMEKKP